MCVEAKLEPWRLELINKSAQEYLSTAGGSQFHKTMQLLAQDVFATIGERHVPVVWSLAKGMQYGEGEDLSRQCIDEVQRYFQDTFVVGWGSAGASTPCERLLNGVTTKSSNYAMFWASVL